MNGRRQTYYPFGAKEPPRVTAHTCAWPGCCEPAEYKAPRDRTLKEYDWYCLAHIREFNRKWNYYAEMDESEVEESVRADTTWQRPSWKLGHIHRTLENSTAAYRAFKAGRVRDAFRVFDEDMAAAADQRRYNGQYAAGRPPRGSDPDKALRVMDLEWPLTREALKARYKELVKRYHPDLNPGDKAAEERFKAVNHAYRTLLGSVGD